MRRRPGMQQPSPHSPAAAQVGRRVFLGLGLAAVGATISCTKGTAGGAWRFFTPAQAQTVDAICAQLIPADQDPGAKEAGVVNFIDLQLSKRFKKYRAAIGNKAYCR